MVASARVGTDVCHFVFGGRRSVHSGMEATCLRYSTGNDSWTECEPMRVARGIGRAVTVQNLIYVLGGCELLGQGLRRADVYDPAGDTWNRIPSLPEDLHDFGAAVWRDSLVFVVGGGNWSPGSPPTDSVWLFNPGTDEWLPCIRLPVPAGALCCGIIDDSIYVATGWTGSGPTNQVWLGAISPANPTDITWLSLDTMPCEPCYRALSTTADQRLFVTGGILGSGAVSNQTWAFDPRTRGWSQLTPKPSPAADVFGLGTTNNRLHFLGGFPGITPYLSVHEVLDVGEYEHDVGVNSILSPQGRLRPDSTYPVTIQVQNFTARAETCTSRVQVTDSAAQQVVFSQDTSLCLGPEQTRTVAFGSFVPSGSRVYHLLALARAPQDENPANDTGRARSHTTIGSDPDGFGYTYESTQEPDTLAFGWLEPSWTDTIKDWDPNPDDGFSLRFLPFPFPFYGDTLWQIHVSTDGFLQTTDIPCPTNRGLPFYDITDLIAPFWDDLTLRESGFVLQDSYPDQVAYTWVRVPRYGAADQKLTFQTALHSDGRIRFNYLDLDGDRTSSTVGIQGQDGSWNWYLEYVYNAEPAWHVPADSVSILFRPPVTGIAESRPSPTRGLALHCPTLLRTRSIPVRVNWTSGTGPELRLIDACGRAVASATVTGDHSAAVRFDLTGSGLNRPAPGVYLLRCQNETGCTTRKLVLLR